MKVKAMLSAIMGFLFGLASFFVFRFIGELDALLWSVWAGLFFYIILIVFLVFYEKAMNKKYAIIEKEIDSPIFYKANGNFTLGNGKIKNGNIYFCEAGIVCACLEEKPYLLEKLSLQDIEHYQFDSIHLNIFTKDGRVCIISMPDVQKVVDRLQEKNWI